MDFNEAINYIKSLDVYGSVLGLGNMHALSQELDYPQAKLRFIHVTGTNGKGSTCAYLGAILKEAGYKVGSYNSPAVLSDIDQFRIDGEIVSDELYAEAVTLVREASESIVENGGVQPTRFEVETMAAFVMFYIEKCDIVICETGLGGRDDATNVIDTTVLHIITKISEDHLGVIGNNIIEIAETKSGIIKSGAPVLMYAGDGGDDSYKEIYKKISDKCNEHGAVLYSFTDDQVTNGKIEDGQLVFDLKKHDLESIHSGMVSKYQMTNASLAIDASYILADLGYRITEASIREGIKNARLPFRFEINKASGIDIVLDGAHNPDGAKLLIDSLKLTYPDRPYIFINGIFKDKDYEKIAQITAGYADKIYVVGDYGNQRALDKNVLVDTVSKYNTSTTAEININTAIDKALEDARGYEEAKGERPVIVCFGSLSWLKYAKEHIDNYHSAIIGNDGTIKDTEDIIASNIINIKTGESTVDAEKIRRGVTLILEGIGEDITREGLVDTPERVTRMYEEILSNVGKAAEVELSRTFSSETKEMVIEKDITFYSMCEHHLMPFFGKAHIAYIPNGKVVGISKLARCVDVYSKKPQIQERLTDEIADAIMQYLKPKGVIVMLEAEHMCMTMRGVKKEGTKTVTLSARGKMKKKKNKALFFELLGK